MLYENHLRVFTLLCILICGYSLTGCRRLSVASDGQLGHPNPAICWANQWRNDIKKTGCMVSRSEGCLHKDLMSGLIDSRQSVYSQTSRNGTRLRVRGFIVHVYWNCRLCEINYWDIDYVLVADDSGLEIARKSPVIPQNSSPSDAAYSMLRSSDFVHKSLRLWLFVITWLGL